MNKKNLAPMYVCLKVAIAIHLQPKGTLAFTVHLKHGSILDVSLGFKIRVTTFDVTIITFTIDKVFCKI